jgi:hypothetical protein
MKTIKISYTTNKQIWKIERTAAEHGYTKTSDCYWAQIFRAEDGSEIITSREESASGDPVAELISALDANQEAQDTAEIMKQAGALELPQRVALYVPGTQDINHATDNAAQVERVAREFCGWFGGATAQPSAGYWLSDSAGLIREAVTIVYAACTADQLRERLPDVLTLAQQIKQDMAQEAVSVELNGTLYII